MSPRRLLSGDPVTITRKRVAAVVAILTAFYAFQGAVLGCAVAQNRQLARQGKQAHDASCARKRRLSDQVNDTMAILDKNPVAPFGIPAKLILRGVARDLAEYDSLAAVRCNPPIQPPRRPKP